MSAGPAKGPRVEQPVIIKKIKKGHGHHGGAWKVAYADFVTAMMSLFMVLWLVSQTDQSTQAEVSQYFRTGVFTGSAGVLPGAKQGLDGNMEHLEAAPAEYSLEEALLQKVAKESAAELQKLAAGDSEAAEVLQHIDIKVTSEGLLIEIIDSGADMAFEVGSAKLTPALARLLAGLGPVLAKLPNPIQIHGHTDARPFPEGSGGSNWELSFERADAARRELVRAGLPESRVKGVQAHGASQLRVPADPFSPSNRRLTLLALRRVPSTENKSPPPASSK